MKAHRGDNGDDHRGDGGDEDAVLDAVQVLSLVNRRIRVIVDREPAVLGRPTEAAVRRLMVGEWLDERRRRAEVRWYWP